MSYVLLPMMRPLSLARMIICTLACAFTTSAFALSTLHFTVTESGQTAKPQTVFLKNGKLMIRAIGGDPNTDMHYQLANQTINIVDHEERTVMPLTEEGLSQFVSQASGVMNVVQQQLAKQMEGMSEAEKEQFKSMLNQFGAGQVTKAPEPVKEVTTINKGRITVNGYDCELTEVHQGNQAVTRLCFSNPDELGISSEDQETVKNMLDMANRLRTQAVKVAQQFGADIPEFGTLNIQKIPIAMDQANMRMRLVKIESTSPDIELPQDYAIRGLPSLPGLQ